MDVETLNIKIGQYCWEIILELTLVKFQGNIIDAMNYAAMALILKYDFRNIKVQDGNLVIEEKIMKKFSLNHVPLLQTFAIFNIEEDLIV